MSDFARRLEQAILSGPHLSAVPESVADPRTSELKVLQELSGLDPTGFLNTVKLLPGAALSLTYLYFSGKSRSLAESLLIRDHLLGVESDSLLRNLLDVFVLGSAIREGTARDYLLGDDSLKRVDKRTDPWSAMIGSLSKSAMGRAYQELGDLKSAHSLLTEAILEAKALPWTLFFHEARLAGLYWASGQPQKALDLYTNEDFKARLAQCPVAQRLAIHLSTAKCAIDCKDAHLASLELQQVLELLPESGRDDFDAYATLYAGELAVLKEEYEKAKALLFSAAARFENLDPPHYVGVLDAKTALSHFAFIEGNRALAVFIVEKLLREAEEKQCLNARSRLLVLQTCVFVSDTPPLRDAFDDIITRLHLINNPALLMQALGNLYTYSLEFLTDRDSAFMLQRIRNLESVLEKSCFDDLYRSYVTERYEYAIENRLARLAEREGDGHDFEDSEDESD